MNKIILVLLVFAAMLSCKKDNIDGNSPTTDPITDPYGLPWNTENIAYTNIDKMCGNHSYGYKLYYKDSLLLEDCETYGGITLGPSLLVNDSILILYRPATSSSMVIQTENGGLSWTEYHAGPPSFVQFHFVNTALTYSITENSNRLFFSGIGQSDLSVYMDSITTGTNYINDFGTAIEDIDSTIIAINDSVKYVVKFH